MAQTIVVDTSNLPSEIYDKVTQQSDLLIPFLSQDCNTRMRVGAHI